MSNTASLPDDAGSQLLMRASATIGYTIAIGGLREIALRSNILETCSILMMQLQKALKLIRCARACVSRSWNPIATYIFDAAESGSQTARNNRGVK